MQVEHNIMSPNFVCWEHLCLCPAVQPWPEVISWSYFSVLPRIFAHGIVQRCFKNYFDSYVVGDIYKSHVCLLLRFLWRFLIVAGNLANEEQYLLENSSKWGLKSTESKFWFSVWQQSRNMHRGWNICGVCKSILIIMWSNSFCSGLKYGAQFNSVSSLLPTKSFS